MNADDFLREISDAPMYDQWRRARPGTGTHALVMAAIAATVDLRTRSAARTGIKPRKRKPADQRTYETLAHAIVSALVHRELCRAGGWVRVPLAHQRAGLRGKNVCPCYRSPAMSRSLPPFVHELHERGWLQLKCGYMERKERIPSVMRASPKLVRQIAAMGCALEDFARDPDRELIILKAAKRKGRDGRGRQFAAEWIDYSDTPETEKMRAEMHELNEWLASLEVGYMQKGVGVDPIGDRTLWRVFNNGSFEMGGRLAGGFWSNMSMNPDKGRLWRGHILIDGEPLAALDFVSMFVRLLYVIAGQQPPRGDLLAGIEGLVPVYREGTKRLMYALLFQDGELIRCPRGARLLLPKGAHIKTMVRNIKNRHAPVAHLLGAGVGMTLFRLESDILLEVLRQCRAAGVAALPMHDAILIAESRAAEAKRAMLKGFKRVTGFNGEVGEPKRPEVGAVELETLLLPDEARDLGDEPDELKRIDELVRLGHRDLANMFAREFTERQQLEGAALAPDAEADWI